VAARGRGHPWRAPAGNGCAVADEVGQNEEGTQNFFEGVLGLNSDTLAVPRQLKNSGAATGTKLLTCLTKHELLESTLCQANLVRIYSLNPDSGSG